MSPKKPKKLDFEESMDQLKELVEKMESGKLSLEESLKFYEKGINLIRNCQTTLITAEQKVQILSQQDDLESYGSN